MLAWVWGTVKLLAPNRANQADALAQEIANKTYLHEAQILMMLHALDKALDQADRRYCIS
jgi:hypothetical protein